MTQIYKILETSKNCDMFFDDCWLTALLGFRKTGLSRAGAKPIGNSDKIYLNFSVGKRDR